VALGHGLGVTGSKHDNRSCEAVNHNFAAKQTFWVGLPFALLQTVGLALFIFV
jgi:hypothetical protein